MCVCVSVLLFFFNGSPIWSVGSLQATLDGLQTLGDAPVGMDETRFEHYKRWHFGVGILCGLRGAYVCVCV